MPLSDVKCRNSKGQARPYKLSDGGGLFLQGGGLGGQRGFAVQSGAAHAGAGEHVSNGIQVAPKSESSISEKTSGAQREIAYDKASWC